MSISFNEGEHVVLEVRRHWFVLFAHSFVVVLLALIPLGFIVNLDILPINFNSEGNIFSFFMFFYLVWLFVLWLYSFYVWTDYYLDIWIITNQKIMAVEQFGFFGRKVSTLTFSKVQNVSTESHGIIATFMGFGTLQVETAGHDSDFILHHVADQDNTRQRINEVLNEFHNNARNTQEV